MPTTIEFAFGVRLKQRSVGTYNHELHVEFFAIGEEIDGDNYILLDRQKMTFNPSRQEDLIYSVMSDRKVRLYDYEFFQDGRRGQKYGGYLIIVTDSRGTVISQKSPYNWISENIENLNRLPVGVHFGKSCRRVSPPVPNRD